MNYKISRNLEYALMALSYMLTRKNQKVSAKEMVKVFHCPFDPLSRVLQKLADKGFIQSKKGLGGGYILNKDLENLSLYELMSIVLPPMEIVDCLSGHCNLLKYCNIKDPIYFLNNKLVEFYKNLNVKDILNCKDTKGSKIYDSIKPAGYKNLGKGLHS